MDKNSDSFLVNFKTIIFHLEEFLADYDMSFFLEKAEDFMREHLSEDMTEEEAISHLENRFLFNENTNKSDVLTAADILRAVRMIRYRRENRN